MSCCIYLPTGAAFRFRCAICNFERTWTGEGEPPRRNCPKAASVDEATIQRAREASAQQIAPKKKCGGCGKGTPIGTQERPLPSLPKRALNLAAAWRRDVKNGRQRRMQEQVNRLFDGFCRNCPAYNLLEQACSECGCPVNKLVSADMKNKLAVASEVCPLEHWPYGEITRRNLLFFILPLRHSLKVWQWHVEQVCKYLPLFNGRRIITVATPGEGNKLAIEPIEYVREVFGEDAAAVEFVERPNDPALWETPAFADMLRLVASTDPHEASFYFHAKGVRRARQDALRLWCEEIYRHNLGRLDDAMEALRYWKAAGIARSPTTPGKGELGYDVPWHFAGTGFWFRHDALFAGDDWQEITPHSHAVEAFLGRHFRADEVYCLAHDNPGAVYDEATWRAAIAKFDGDAAGEKPDASEVKVSIIVTARNYGPFLRDCLESCGWQTHKPHEIIYCDDASDDDSLAIVSDLWTKGELRPFRVVGLDAQLGAVAARNHAASLATGNTLLFVDGDDVLPADYLAKCVERLTFATPFVYTDVQCFGRENRYVRQPDWGQRDLRAGNFCNTSALIWRDAFDAAGRWQDNGFGRFPDWHLFLRLAHLGTPRRADVALGYRKHGQSWSDIAEAATTPEERAKIWATILRSVDEWAAHHQPVIALKS